MTFSVHRLVAQVFIDNPNNKLNVDHIDNDISNNHFNNLRWATAQENSQNIGISKKNTSGTKGVYFVKSRNKWYVSVVENYKAIFLGYYDTIEEAKKARQD